MSRAVLENSGTVYNSIGSGNITNSYNNEFNRCNISVSDDRRQVPEWLSPLASRERHRAVRDTRVDGVGDWLLRDPSFSTWRTSEDRAAKPVLLCYGDPGAGKTYISSLVIDTLSKRIDRDGVAIAYVYCDFSTRDAQSASTVLGSVLRQVVGALPEIPEEVQKAFEGAKKQVDSCGLLLPEILEMLIKSLSRLKRSFICIDALDEFPLKQQPDLWGSLQRVVRERPDTGLFLTGRPHIRDQVRNYFPRSAEMLAISPRESDIELYLEMRLSKDPEFDAMDEGLRADILRLIPERISGLFLLVCINMDAILAEPTIHRRRQVLRQMANGLGLQGAYKATLDRIKQQGGSKSRIGMEALMWISYCERPLSPQELCYALGVELGAEDFNTHNVPSIRTVLGCVLGLVTIDEEESTVRLLHFTLQEYLEAGPTLFVTAHSIMAEICLTYLDCPSVRALPPNLDMARTRAPFLEYATCFWGAHAAREVTEPVKALALRVLDGYENHVSANIFWYKKLRRFVVWEDKGISGLHCIAFWGIAEIAIAMLETKRWDVNRHDYLGDTPLMWAVSHGNSRVVEILLGQEDVEPNAVNTSGDTALSLAARSGKEGLVKPLLGCGGVNPDLPGNNGRTPLSYAAGAWREQEHIVELLLERVDVNPDSSDSNGWTPLSFAVLRNHEGVVNLLLKREDVNPDSSDNNGRTPLSYAAEKGRDHLTKQFLERADVNPNSSDNDGRTPLSYAVPEKHGGVVKLLLELGDVNPDLPDSDGRTPLSYAARALPEQEGIVELLLERKDINPDLSDKQGRTPLSYAAWMGHKRIVKLLLRRRDVNPNSSDNNGRTPLSYVIGSSEEKDGIVKLLLERADVNPNLSDNMGRTPLSYAAWRRHESMVRLLLERRDIDPDFLDSKGRTSLSYAAWRGCEGIAKLLLQRRDVNPNSSDYTGRTPLSFASQEGAQSVVRLLLGRGDVNPNIEDTDGRTPLSYAAVAELEHKGIVKLLLERGDVNPDFHDNRGQTPLSFAAWRGHQGVVNLLLQRADVDPDSSDYKGRTPLSFAAWRGHHGVVKLLLQRRDVNPNSSDNKGRTPLSLAAEWEQERIAQLLLERVDLNPDLPDNSGRTPLSYAAEWGLEHLVKQFLERGDVNRDSPDINGRTPLSYAIMRGRGNVVKLFP